MVMLVMVAVVVIGVIGGVASVLSYDNLYSQRGSEMRIPKHSRRSRQAPRPSRQLRAVEAALEKDPSADQPASCSPARSHGRWPARRNREA